MLHILSTSLVKVMVQKPKTTLNKGRSEYAAIGAGPPRHHYKLTGKEKSDGLLFLVLFFLLFFSSVASSIFSHLFPLPLHFLSYPFYKSF